jgi:hypothetical protein
MINSGIADPRHYRDALIHEWYLQSDYREKLSVFILKETTKELFFFNIKDGELKIKGKQYSITWINSPSVCRENTFLLVSLRYCPLLERGYALVQVLKGDGQYEQLEY